MALDPLDNDRRVFLQPYTDGTAELSAINLPPATAAAAFNRVDRIARAAKSFGDVRTLPQLRADAMLDLLSGRPFMLSPSLDTLTAEADQAARNLGYGVDDPDDLAGTMPPPKPRHRPGTRSTSTKTSATKTSATQRQRPAQRQRRQPSAPRPAPPRPAPPRPVPPRLVPAVPPRPQRQRPQRPRHSSQCYQGRCWSWGWSGCQWWGGRADRCGVGNGDLSYPDVGGIPTVTATTIRMNGPARQTSTSSPPCSPTTTSATTIRATTSATTTSRRPDDDNAHDDNLHDDNAHDGRRLGDPRHTDSSGQRADREQPNVDLVNAGPVDTNVVDTNVVDTDLAGGDLAGRDLADRCCG